MEAVRTIWTDERMDDLNQKVDGLATETREEFRAVRSEMHEGFREVHARLDALQRAMLTMTISVSGSIIAGFLALLATQL